ncbi:MAG: bacterial Ig-like domain-containing protein [Clostridia bacterium]|nr:bacterial Ig-like domain-containing protein [Clostridia bacterium]
MKKILATLIAVIFIISAFSVLAFAAETAEGHPLTLDMYGGYLKSYSGLDFSNENNIWTVYDEDSGKWVYSEKYSQFLTDGTYNSKTGKLENVTKMYYSIFDDDEGIYQILIDGEWVEEDWDYPDNNDLIKIPASPYISSLGKDYLGSGSKTRLEWEVSPDGEYITFKSVSTSASPGIAFEIDESRKYFTIGKETDEDGTTHEAKPHAEYAAIRVRNRSSASLFSFAVVTSSTNGGNAFTGRAFFDYKDESYKSNSGEWETYIINMAQIAADNNENSAWNSNLRALAIFPFGYGKTDGTGAYNGAEIDIDYIVIGSKEYCENYKSELQKEEESVSSIKLISEPTKKDYRVGDTLDLSGLVIEATYDDGRVEEITDCGASYDFTTAPESGKTTVTLKYGTKTTPITYEVNISGIKSVSINGIDADEKPYPTSFEISKVANGITAELIKGLTLTVEYEDGYVDDKYTPTSRNCELSGKEAGTQVVTVNLYGTKASYSVNVINVSSITVNGVKKTVHYGETIEKGDLDITCVYSDGSEKSISDAGLVDSITDITYSTKTAGETEISVTVVNEAYGVNITGTGKMTVETPKALVVKSNPTKTTYTPGDTLDTTGLVLAYTYEDGAEREVAIADVDKPKYDFSEPGEKTVTITSGSLSATFTVTVDGTAPTRPASSSKPASSGGCGSFIGAGAIAVIACATAAGVVICKKKDN